MFVLFKEKQINSFLRHNNYAFNDVIGKIQIPFLLILVPNHIMSEG
jgi:hypothetical protein